MPVLTVFAELRSVCVAGLFFGVYGEVKSLQVSQVQHATTCPFDFSIYFVVLWCFLRSSGGRRWHTGGE